jgi:hypothetical protein
LRQQSACDAKLPAPAGEFEIQAAVAEYDALTSVSFHTIGSLYSAQVNAPAGRQFDDP